MRLKSILLILLQLPLSIASAAQLWFDLTADRCFLPVNPLYASIEQTASIPPDPSPVAALSQKLSKATPDSLALSLVGRDTGGPVGMPGIDSLFDLSILAAPTPFPASTTIEIEYIPRDASGTPVGAVTADVVTVQPTFFDIDFSSTSNGTTIFWRIRGLTTPFEPLTFQKVLVTPIDETLRLHVELAKSSAQPNFLLPVIRMSITAVAVIPEPASLLAALSCGAALLARPIKRRRPCYTPAA